VRALVGLRVQAAATSACVVSFPGNDAGCESRARKKDSASIWGRNICGSTLVGGHDTGALRRSQLAQLTHVVLHTTGTSI